MLAFLKFFDVKTQVDITIYRTHHLRISNILVARSWHFCWEGDGLGFKDKSNSPQNWIAGVCKQGALEVLQSHTSRWSRHGPTTSSLAPANKKGQKCVNCLSWLQALDPWNKFANLHCDLSQEFFFYPHPGPWICADKFTQVGFRFKKFNVYF